MPKQGFGSKSSLWNPEAHNAFVRHQPIRMPLPYQSILLLFKKKNLTIDIDTDLYFLA